MIKVLTHYTKNWQPIADIVIPNLHEYCQRHSYELDVDIVSYDVYNGIEKLNQINRLKLGDIALVIDADAMITNHNIKIEDFLNDEADFYICEGLNAGVFIVRKTQWLVSFVNYLISLISVEATSCEQDAIAHYIESFGWSKKISILKHPAFNSYMSQLYPEIQQPVTEQQGQWAEGCYVLHAPALSLEKRVGLFKSIKITK